MATHFNTLSPQDTDFSSKLNGHSSPTQRSFRIRSRTSGSRKQSSLFRVGSLEEDSGSPRSSSTESLNSQPGSTLNHASSDYPTTQSPAVYSRCLSNGTETISDMCLEPECTYELWHSNNDQLGSEVIPSKQETNIAGRVGGSSETKMSQSNSPALQSSPMTDTNFTEWLINSSCKHMSLEKEMTRESEIEVKNRSLTSKFKTVTFADSCGKDLLHVLSFENFQEADFTVYDSCEDLSALCVSASDTKSFAPLFFLPPSNAAFLEKTREQKVKLESIQIFGTKVLGSILVANLGFMKEVCIRYSLDAWDTSLECSASYVPGSSFQDCDRFSFNMNFDPVQISDKVVFCVRYKCDAGEFWDNNQGLNYSLKLLSC